MATEVKHLSIRIRDDDYDLAVQMFRELHPRLSVVDAVGMAIEAARLAGSDLRKQAAESYNERVPPMQRGRAAGTRVTA